MVRVGSSKRSFKFVRADDAQPLVTSVYQIIDQTDRTEEARLANWGVAETCPGAVVFQLMSRTYNGIGHGL